MKKLLLVSIVALGFVHQMSPMAFKRNEKRQFVPGIRAGELRYREKKKENTGAEPVVSLIIVAKGSDDKPIMVPAKEYKTEQSTLFVKKHKNDAEPKNKGLILTAVVDKETKKPVMIEAKDKDGKALYMQKTVLNKDAMKQWCDNFKRNSKQPGLWDKDYKEEKEVNYQGCGVCFLNDNLVKESFKHIGNEAGLNSSINGIQVTYVDKTEYKEDAKYAGLKLTNRDDISLKGAQYFVNFDKSPHYKTLKQDRVTVENALENYAFHDALESSETLKKEMQNDLSLYHWIFNNQRYNGTKKSLRRVNKEIERLKTPAGRDLFAKSSMHPDLYQQLKKARE